MLSVCINTMEEWMDYRIMRMICMFDLPVESPAEQKVYRDFRKNLIKEGFTMMQYSVYIRTCPNREYFNQLEKRIRAFAPDRGNIRLVGITEKQYSDIKIIVGSKNETERLIGSERMIRL